MKIWCPYESMEDSAALCPKNKNIKLLFRHSIRFDQEGNDVQLTPEGRVIASRFGKYIDMPIGIISSSPVQRCIDTCKEIIEGYTDNKKEIEIIPSNILKVAHIEDKIIAAETFKKLNRDGLFEGFTAKASMPGIYDLETSSLRIINYMFEVGNNNGSLDLFCTHDFQIAMILLYIFGNTKIYLEKLLSNEWPLMLEGMFFWKNENDICLSWRGEIFELWKGI